MIFFENPILWVDLSSIQRHSFFIVNGFSFLCSTRPRAEQSLVRWATPQLHDIDALAKMVDPALKGIYPAKSLSRFADIIALCVQVSKALYIQFVDEPQLS
jgi:hypothetical protein